jgi:hypothetical protein
VLGTGRGGGALGPLGTLATCPLPAGCVAGPLVPRGDVGVALGGGEDDGAADDVGAVVPLDVLVVGAPVACWLAGGDVTTGREPVGALLVACCERIRSAPSPPPPTSIARIPPTTSTELRDDLAGAAGAGGTALPDAPNAPNAGALVAGVGAAALGGALAGGA